MNEKTLAPWAEKSYPLPYKNCLVLGHVCDEKGLKMSKSKGNYLDPWKILDNEGADALRWYFYSSNQPWTSVRFFESAIRDAQKDFLVRLRNVYSFFVIYANIDEFDPSAGIKDDGREFTTTAWEKSSLYVPLSARTELDQWMISYLETATQTVTQNLQAMNILNAAQTLNALVDALSNWFVRRSRERFWQNEKNVEKWAAYWTLYETLARIAVLIAPFTPFMAEEIYQRLFRDLFPQLPESVHLTKWCEYDATRVKREIEQRMEAVRTITTLGLAARAVRKLKVRQPLSKAIVIARDKNLLQAIKAMSDVIKEELNVKILAFSENAAQYVDYEVKPDFKKLGSKLGAKMKACAAKIATIAPSEIFAALENNKEYALEIDDEKIILTHDDLVVRITAKDGFAAQSGEGFVVAIDENITPELMQEGLAREVVNRIQNIRKELDLPYQARIKLSLAAPIEIATAINVHRDYIMQETLATELITPFCALTTVREFLLDEHKITVAVAVEK